MYTSRILLTLALTASSLTAMQTEQALVYRSWHDTCKVRITYADIQKLNEIEVQGFWLEMPGETAACLQRIHDNMVKNCPDSIWTYLAANRDNISIAVNGKALAQCNGQEEADRENYQLYSTLRARVKELGAITTQIELKERTKEARTILRLKREFCNSFCHSKVLDYWKSQPSNNPQKAFFDTLDEDASLTPMNDDSTSKARRLWQKKVLPQYESYTASEINKSADRFQQGVDLSSMILGLTSLYEEARQYLAENNMTSLESFSCIPSPSVVSSMSSFSNTPSFNLLSFDNDSDSLDLILNPNANNSNISKSSRKRKVVSKTDRSKIDLSNDSELEEFVASKLKTEKVKKQKVPYNKIDLTQDSDISENEGWVRRPSTRKNLSKKKNTTTFSISKEKRKLVESLDWVDGSIAKYLKDSD